MHARVLIIEDIREMAELIGLYLGKEGIQTEIAESAEAGFDSLKARAFDLVVLDVNLPGMDGFEFLQRFRASSRLPVIIVSARETDEDIVMGLGAGADEFVVKPFSPKVLAARVRALLRRASEAADAARAIVRFGRFSLDVEGYLLRRDNERIPLSAKEFDVLTCLVSRAGKPLSPEAIYDAVWKNRYGDLTTVAVYIQRLRRKIEEDPQAPRWIETVHGAGYRFNPEGIP